MGFVTYSATGKSGFLGVREETMKRYGLTSKDVAREMSEGARSQEACCADVAESNTGVTDVAPGGGPPPGTQCFAWSYKLRGGEIVIFSGTKAFNGE
jgi:nicotinamide-nucleotide amidase